MPSPSEHLFPLQAAHKGLYARYGLVSIVSDRVKVERDERVDEVEFGSGASEKRCVRLRVRVPNRRIEDNFISFCWVEFFGT